MICASGSRQVGDAGDHGAVPERRSDLAERGAHPGGDQRGGRLVDRHRFDVIAAAQHRAGAAVEDGHGRLIEHGQGGVVGAVAPQRRGRGALLDEVPARRAADLRGADARCRWRSRPRRSRCRAPTACSRASSRRTTRLAGWSANPIQSSHRRAVRPSAPRSMVPTSSMASSSACADGVSAELRVELGQSSLAERLGLLDRLLASDQRGRGMLRRSRSPRSTPAPGRLRRGPRRTRGWSACCARRRCLS